MDSPAGLLGVLLQVAGEQPFLETWRQIIALAMGIIGGVAAVVGFIYLGVTLRLVALMEKVRRT